MIFNGMSMIFNFKCQWSLVVLCIGIFFEETSACFLGLGPGGLGVFSVLILILRFTFPRNVHDFRVHFAQMTGLAAFENDFGVFGVDMRHFRATLLDCILLRIEVIRIGQEAQKLSMGFLQSHSVRIMKRLGIEIPFRNGLHNVIQCNLNGTFCKRFELVRGRNGRTVLEVLCCLLKNLGFQGLDCVRFAQQKGPPIRHLFDLDLSKTNHKHTNK